MDTASIIYLDMINSRNQELARMALKTPQGASENALPQASTGGHSNRPQQAQEDLHAAYEEILLGLHVEMSHIRQNLAWAEEALQEANKLLQTRGVVPIVAKKHSDTPDLEAAKQIVFAYLDLQTIIENAQDSGIEDNQMYRGQTLATWKANLVKIQAHMPPALVLRNILQQMHAG